MAKHIAHHGDGVRDVAFTVSDARVAYAEAMKRGAESVREPEELKDEAGNILHGNI
jgi:4-hydroxyphenylpyruvate dioxygenase